jgi:tetratricopeptide (TPR) repeat protein
MRHKRYTSQAFRDTLRNALEADYQAWQTYPFDVSTKAIESWISGKNRPNVKTFDAFLTSADRFSEAVRETLWQLYKTADTPSPTPNANADNRDLMLVQEIIDMIVEMSIRHLNSKSAEQLIEKARARFLPNMAVEQAEYFEFYIKLALIPIYRGLAQIDDLMALFEDMDRQIRAAPDLNDILKARFYHHRGVVRCYIQAEYQAAIEDYQRACSLFCTAQRDCDTPGVLVDTGMAYWCMGDLHNAESFIEKGQNAAGMHDRRDTYMIATGNLGLVNLGRGKLTQALTFIQRHLELALAINHEKEMLRAQANRGIVNFFLGNYEDSTHDLSIDVKHSQGETEGISLAYAYLGLCHLKMGRRENAVRVCEQALWIAEKNDLIHAKISALRAMAEVAADVENARGYLLEALELARGRSAFQEAGCLLSLGRLMPDVRSGKALYEEGKNKLARMGGRAWIENRAFEDPPFIMMM